MTPATLDQLIEDIKQINDDLSPAIPYNLHAFLHTLHERGMMKAFEVFLRHYRHDRNNDN